MGVEVVPCAGTIGTATIALNSGLQQDNHLVGKGMIDHEIWSVRFARRVRLKGEKLPSIKLNCLIKICDRLALLNVIINVNGFFGRGPGISSTEQCFSPDGDLESALIFAELEFTGSLRDDNEVINIPSPDPVIRIRRLPDLLEEKYQMEMQDLATRIRNGVILPTKPDDLAPRMSRAGFGVVAHEVGTMCMEGPKTKGGVVGENLCVKGFKNLHVCDLSVFPVSPPSNPSLTLAALSLRRLRGSLALAIIDDDCESTIEVDDNERGLLYTAKEVAEGIKIKEEDKNDMTTDSGVESDERFDPDEGDADFDDAINGDEDMADENI
ncbi:hypothetical protein G7Y89_g10173 [Cudoniella acicularis]|uniref:Glucose-methanol-choline oxidoreductase C-terminal domain-containing protein n=1 Tax=Cudoniella acicularis TaxID=354080 RepID=A0A8H4RFK0_9HELO|nr:hypothetical protein G7Y89_g10173 [Cudoniella acicularis]